MTTMVSIFLRPHTLLGAHFSPEETDNICERNSMIAFAIGIVVGVSAIAMSVESIFEVFY
jgi:hypothetical protein